jgi:dTDP-4-dehydrorhamnose 3,5-epimerase
MKVVETPLIDASVITVDKYQDERGFFMESFNEEQFLKEIGSYKFVQDNHSKSSKGVLRGLHYQVEKPQGKLVRCIQGAVYDVILDLRKSSSTFGLWFSITLDNPETIMWVPPGFAHGFYTLTDTAEFEYKCTDYYHPQSMKTLMWDDPDLSITWPTMSPPLLSEKDAQGKTFEECDKYE